MWLTFPVRKAAIVVLLVLVGCGTAFSQSGDPRERQREFEQAYSDLRHLDANRNGIIEPNEATGGTSHSHKDMFEKAMAKAGLPPTLPVQMDVVRDRLVSIYQGSTSSSPGGIRSSGPSLVPGFGAPVALAPAPGFGVPSNSSSSSSSSSSRSSSGPPPSSSSGSIDPKMREFAENIVRQNDKNKNGVLDRDEWGGLRGDPNEMDRNRDGRITADELAERFAASRRDRGGSSSGRSGESDSKMPRRFRTAHEFLPKGLPGWFVEKDDDLDGQVSMAEYSGQWSDGLAAEFLKYDLNSDGLITPQECLDALKSMSPPQDNRSSRR